MRIIKTTDGLHLGKDLGSVNTGDVLDLDGFEFYVADKRTLENGHIVLINVNYQLELED